ncbi:MAG: hypothetical protein ACYTHJ_07515 [Planctomycetota bacterium]
MISPVTGFTRIVSCTAAIFMFTSALHRDVCAQDPEPNAAGTDTYLAVAWNDMATATGRLQLMRAAPPWFFEGPIRTIGIHARLRFAENVLFVINPELDRIDAYAPDGLPLIQSYALSPGCQPRDIAVVDPDTAYVTCADATHLVRLNLNTGQWEEVIDLSIFADEDGVPDLEMMEFFEGRLFIQIRRIGSQPLLEVHPAIAVMDVASETLIDVNATLPGIQAIELVGTAPKFKMQVVPHTRRLFVSATGDFFDAGGLEMIDLDSLQSLGLVIAEADGLTGADLGAFVLTTSAGGFLTYSTDLATSSHLKPFTITGGVPDGPELYFSLGYFVPTFALDARSLRLFYPQGTLGETGIDVFHAGTGTRLTEDTIPTSGQPTDMVLLCGAACAGTPAVPATSSYGLLIMLLLLVTVLTLVKSRPAPA